MLLVCNSNTLHRGRSETGHATNGGAWWAKTETVKVKAIKDYWQLNPVDHPAPSFVPATVKTVTAVCCLTSRITAQPVMPE